MSKATTRSHQPVAPGRVLRYDFTERLTHWAVGISYLYLLFTGLAFYTPWLFWLTILGGGGQVSRMLHPWFGVVFSIGVVQMYRMWASEMNITQQDKDWFNSVGYYVQNEDEKMPPVGRYNGGQKSLFWGFVACMILLLLSGIVMWLPEYIPWSLRYLRYAAVLTHVSAALITIGFFLIHVYMGVFAERGAMDSMIHGDVSLHFARRYHPAWYEEITGQPANPRK